MPLSLAKLHLRYQGHIATRQKQRHDERCSWVEPWDRIAWHSILSEIAQDDSLEKQRSGRMMALHCRSRAGPAARLWASECRRLVIGVNHVTPASRAG